MRYLFLAYGDERRWNALPADERTALESACQAHDDVLRQKGHLIAVEAFQSSATSTVVRVQDGQLCLSDGPWAAASTPLIAFYLISARDLNEAIRVASTMPQAHNGPIEVWPLTT